MSCASEPRGRALEALADPAWAKGAIRRIRRGAGCSPQGSTYLGQEGPGRWWFGLTHDALVPWGL